MKFNNLHSRALPVSIVPMTGHGMLLCKKTLGESGKGGCRV